MELGIEYGSIKKFYYKSMGEDKVVIGVYVNDDIVKGVPYAILFGVDKNGFIVRDVAPVSEITFTATKLDPSIREKLLDVYETYKKKEKIQERTQKYLDEINRLRGKIGELDIEYRNIDSLIDKKLSRICNKQGFLSKDQFIEMVIKYLSKNLNLSVSDCDINNNVFIIQKEQEVARMSLREIEDYGLAYVHSDGGVEPNDYDTIKRLPIVKQWESKYSLKNYILKSLVNDYVLIGDKGHIYFYSELNIELIKPLTPQYAKEIAYKILGKKVTKVKK